MDLKEGDVLVCPQGTVEIHVVDNGQVYFLQTRRGDDEGVLTRMAEETFLGCIDDYKLEKQDFTDAKLVEAAVRNAGHGSNVPMPRWAHVRDAFAVGSRSARELCYRFELDPD